MDRAALGTSLWRDASWSAIVAGFVAVLVGYASSAAIVFEAALALGADDRAIASWMDALGLGMGVTCIALSLAYRAPIVTAWSTPGAALLAGAACRGDRGVRGLRRDAHSRRRFRQLRPDHAW